MESVIYYHRKYGEAAVPFILTIQSKEIGPSHKFKNLHPPTNVAKNVATIKYLHSKKNPRNFRGKPRLKAMKNAFLPVAFH